MFFSEKQDLKKFSSNLIQLGYLMAGGDPEDPVARKQIFLLGRSIQKMNSQHRPIENMRIFQTLNLTDSQKLKIYELFLQTLGKASWQSQRGFNFHFRSSPLPEKQKASLQVLEAQAGAWVAFVITVGAMLATPFGSSQKILNFGIFLGRTLQGLKDLQSYQAQIRSEDRECCIHYQQAFRRAQQDLSEVLQKIRSDFQLPETSLAFQMAQKLGLTFARGD